MSIVYESSTLQQRAVIFYREAYTERIGPHRQQIEALVRRADEEGFQSDDVPPGDHVRNLRKFFAPERPTRVTEPMVETLPTALDEGGFDILDVGCGLGEHMAVFRAAGNRVVGVCGGDGYYVEHFRYVHELLGLDVRYADITQPWEFPDASFDFVFSAMNL